MPAGINSFVKIRRAAGIFFLVFPGIICARTLYVDGKLSEDCVDYDVSARSCGSGTNLAFANHDVALQVVKAGDTLLLRGGLYSQLNIRSSGTPTKPINVRGFPGEKVMIQDSSEV